MLGANIEKALNRQIVMELYSANLYLSMAAYCESLSLVGCAKWLEKQYAEELAHAHKIYDHVNARDGRVRLGQVSAPPQEWSSPAVLFADAHRHEQAVSQAINEIVDLALKENDHMTFEFLQWFVKEQVEEEDQANKISDRFKLAGESSCSVLLLDQELGQRE